MVILVRQGGVDIRPASLVLVLVIVLASWHPGIRGLESRLVAVAAIVDAHWAEVAVHRLVWAGAIQLGTQQRWSLLEVGQIALADAGVLASVGVVSEDFLFELGMRPLGLRKWNWNIRVLLWAVVTLMLA